MDSYHNKIEERLLSSFSDWWFAGIIVIAYWLGKQLLEISDESLEWLIYIFTGAAVSVISISKPIGLFIFHIPSRIFLFSSYIRFPSQPINDAMIKQKIIFKGLIIESSLLIYSPATAIRIFIF